MSELSRRRFLIGLLAGIGAGSAGLAARRLRGAGGEAEAVPATPPPTATTAAPVTTLSADASPPETTVNSTTTTSSTTTTTDASPSTTIPVICRDAWGAASIAGDFTHHEIEQITVHHTAVFLENNADAPERVRRHQAYHQSLGWPDLAYHYIIDAAGNVYEGRPVDAVGDTATEYDPTGHLLICCEGNFDEQEVPDGQYETLILMVAWGCRTYGVEPDAVGGHRDLATTSCPGAGLYEPIASGRLATEVENAPPGNLLLESVCGERGAALVASIEAG